VGIRSVLSMISAIDHSAGATTPCWSALRRSVATELETEQSFRDVVPNDDLDQLRFGYWLRKRGVERLLQFGEFVSRKRSDAAGYSHGRLPDLRTRTLVRDVIVNEKRRLMGHASLPPAPRRNGAQAPLLLPATGQTALSRPLNRRLSLFRPYPPGNDRTAAYGLLGAFGAVRAVAPRRFGQLCPGGVPVVRQSTRSVGFFNKSPDRSQRT
jgi:hypothetical protein